jgi:hypothetical protein
VNGSIILMKDFMIDHKKISPYHPQDNGVVDSFNKIIHKGLTKLCGVDIDDWDTRYPLFNGL